MTLTYSVIRCHSSSKLLVTLSLMGNQSAETVGGAEYFTNRLTKLIGNCVCIEEVCGNY